MSAEAKLGDYRIICDYSGFKIWRSEAQRTWQGYLVHRRFAGAEVTRHPQDLVRAVPDNGSVPDARPEAPDVFLSPGDVTPADL